MCEQKNEDYGIVYALINEAMPGLVKIGMTSKQDMNERLSQLFTTGVPYPFKCLYACKVAHVKKVEKTLHKAFEDFRVKSNREFFKIEPDKVVGILELLGPNNMQDTVNEIITRDDDMKHNTFSNNIENRSKNTKKDSYDFAKMGIPVGAKLQSQFKKHENIEVEVIDSHNKVRYNNEEVTLSNITKKITGYTHPTPLWTYNGKNLEELWKKSIKSTNDRINGDNMGNKKDFATKNPNYNFSEMKIPLGAMLKFKADENIKAEVVDSKNKVRWNGLEDNLTSITRIIYNEKFKGKYKSDPTRAILHWNYNGTCLFDIYKKNYLEISKSKKSIHPRWSDPIGTVEGWSHSSGEEVQRLKKESFERLLNFVKNGNKE